MKAEMTEKRRRFEKYMELAYADLDKISRGVYRSSVRTTSHQGGVMMGTADFIGTPPEEIVRARKAD